MHAHICFALSLSHSLPRPFSHFLWRTMRKAHARVKNCTFHQPSARTTLSHANDKRTRLSQETHTARATPPRSSHVCTGSHVGTWIPAVFWLEGHFLIGRNRPQEPKFDCTPPTPLTPHPHTPHVYNPARPWCSAPKRLSSCTLSLSPPPRREAQRQPH